MQRKVITITGNGSELEKLLNKGWLIETAITGPKSLLVILIKQTEPTANIPMEELVRQQRPPNWR